MHVLRLEKMSFKVQNILEIKQIVGIMNAIHASLF